MTDRTPRHGLDARLSALWPRLEPLLDALVELRDEAERAAHLAAISAGDPELGALAAELCSRAADGDDPGSDTAGETLPALLDDAFGLRIEAATEPDARWGPYRRLRSLGEGGAGRVFLAERDDGQFRQQVAVKVLRTEIDSGEARERLKRERQFLARLDHPGLSRLIDGGIGSDGRPWFAMEYVEGEPITNYADRERLTRAARLELFGKLLAAVRYLHQNLLVHRDLKPANVLVTPAGDVRLLDLGIARLLDDHAGRDSGPVANDAAVVEGATIARAASVAATSLAATSLATQSRAVIAPAAMTQADIAKAAPTQTAMTPAYAAPEQIFGQPATTAIDVYALGLVLQELLTGRAPFPAGRFAADRSGRIGELRPPEPPGINADLDAIIGRALREEPDQRYPSAEALAEDLNRYRRGSPVAARQGGWRYRTGKSLRRHRVAWTAMAALVATLSAGLIATLWQARVAKRAAERAEAVSGLLLHIFEGADPEVEQGPATTARTLLDRGTRRVQAELSSQRRLQAEMLHTLGGLYSKLGDYDEAWNLFRESWRLRQTLPGLALRDRLASLTALGQAAQALGHDAQAESLFRASLSAMAKTHSESPLDLATAHDNLASVLNERGEGAAAESLARLALDERRRHGADDLDVAETLNGLATIAFSRGRYDEAERWYREALAVYERRLGPGSLRVAALRSNLAASLAQLGRPAEAESLYRLALEVQRQQLGDDHPRVAGSLSGLAGLAAQQDRLAEAVPLYTEVLRIHRHTYGARHPEVAKALHDLARAQQRCGRFAEADSAYRECLSILTEMLGPRHPFVGKTLSSLADLRRRTGEFAAAIAAYRESLDILTVALGTQHELTAQASVGLGRTLIEAGRPAEAEPWLRPALDALSRQLPEDDPRVVEVRRLLALAQRPG